ncbi:MAG: hypothetical protein JEZ04_10885 [Spirochaetales bacterium]|nr:hypothetical protein [Spirochaetales bacterium]
MRGLKPITYLLLIFAVPAVLAAASTPEKEDTYSAGVFPGTRLESLSEKAVETEFLLKSYDDGGVQKLYAVSDYNAFFYLDIEDIAAVLVDHDNGEKVFSRMVDTVDLNPEDDLSVPHRQRVHNSVKFLGIGADYIYTTLLTIERHTADEFILHWKMLDCEEGNFEEYEGFWYLKKAVQSEGCLPGTYVRLRAETVFSDLMPFQELIMSMFTAGETIDVFDCLKRAVETRNNPTEVK